MTVTVDRSVEDFVATPRQMFIDGQWVDAASGQTFETPNPATGETWPTWPKATPKTSTAPSAPPAGPSKTVHGAG